MTPPMRRPLLLCCAMLLAACATPAPPVPALQLVRSPIPPPLLLPPSLPPLPAPASLTQGAVAELLLRQDAALAACIDQLGAIARLEAATP